MRLVDMQLERWGVTFATWPAAGVLAGAPVDLRALERAAALVRPGVGEGVRDWGEVAASMGESYSSSSPAMVWDVRGSFHFGSADPHAVGGVDAVRLPRKRATFSLLAYDTARLEDLLRRPMPRLNVPAATEPLMTTSLNRWCASERVKPAQVWARTGRARPSVRKSRCASSKRESADI